MQTTINNYILWELEVMNFFSKIYDFIKKIAGIIGIILFLFIIFPVLFVFAIILANLNNKNRLEKLIKYFENADNEQKAKIYQETRKINQLKTKPFLFKNFLSNYKKLQEYIDKHYYVLNNNNNLNFFNKEKADKNATYIASHSILDDWNNPENDHWDEY